jgi:predicted phosphodiesterase
VLRLALLADVHADVDALEAALSRIDGLGCDTVVCAGDLVDYGPYPEETITLLRERRIQCICGNHDRWALEDPGAAPGSGRRRFGGDELSASARAFLAALPTGWDAILAGVRVAVRHGSPRSDMDGFPASSSTAELAAIWLDLARADVLVVGHTHRPFSVRAAGGGLVVNPGALLRGAALAPALDFFAVGSSLYPAAARVAGEGGTFGVLELPALDFRVLRVLDGAEVPLDGSGG